MPTPDVQISGYKAMWLFTMFDLPVKTPKERKSYTQFRNLLLDNGFGQMQYSIYARFCASEEIANTYKSRIERAVPDDGYVRLLSVTDRQFAKMQCFYGKNSTPVEDKPDQLTLF